MTEELKIQINKAQENLDKEVEKFISFLNPNLTEEQIEIGKGEIIDLLTELGKKKEEQIKTLDECKTFEDIDAWRKANGI